MQSDAQKIWQVRISIANVEFTSDSFETERDALVLKANVEGRDAVQNAEVVLR